MHNGCFKSLHECGSRFLEVLSQLTVVGEVSYEEFRNRFRSMSLGETPSYYVVVIEDVRLALLPSISSFSTYCS